jgi:hypothetical protein
VSPLWQRRAPRNRPRKPNKRQTIFRLLACRRHPSCPHYQFAPAFEMRLMAGLGPRLARRCVATFRPVWGSADAICMKHEGDRGIGPRAKPRYQSNFGLCHRSSATRRLPSAIRPSTTDRLCEWFLSKLPLRKRMAVGLPESGHHPPGPPCATSARLLLGAAARAPVVEPARVKM